MNIWFVRGIILGSSLGLLVFTTAGLLLGGIIDSIGTALGCNPANLWKRFAAIGAISGIILGSIIGGILGAIIGNITTQTLGIIIGALGFGIPAGLPGLTKTHNGPTDWKSFHQSLSAGLTIGGIIGFVVGWLITSLDSYLIEWLQKVSYAQMVILYSNLR